MSQNSNNEQPNNPLHGVKLLQILEELVAYYGWEELGQKVNIRSFNYDPSIKSSLKFLRRTPWAREKVEQLYLDMLHDKED
ncbi:DNA-binding protein VF530 [Flavobacteriaceae bacterium Ap0902]|nr:DNA-binding protein VF530 [Flavobacteriaceae bacterium Ap0902]